MGRGKFLRSLRQRWWLLALIILPVTLGTYFVSALSKARYEGFMTLADRRDSDAKLAEPYPDLYGRSANDQEIRVLNLANTLSSYTVLKTAWDELTAARVIDNRQMDEIDFIRQVAVSPVRGTEYLQVSYVDKNPNTAKTVISTIYDKFLNRYRQLNSTAAADRIAFIEAQLKDAQKSYEAKLQEQREFQDQHKGAIAFQQSTSGLVTQLAQAKQRLAEAERFYESARGQLEASEKQLRDIEVNKANPLIVKVRNPAYYEIENRINQSRAQLKGFMERYGPKHPSILSVQSAIEEDVELLKITPQFYDSPQQTELSQAFQTALEAKLAAQRQIGAMQAEMRNANRSINEVQANIDELPTVEKQLTLLAAQILAEQNTVTNLTQKVSEARTKKSQSEAPTIFMLDDPSSREVPRNTTLKTLVALFLSSIVAISLIASLGQIDQGTYTPIEAENSLGFPVIGVLPRSGQQRLNTAVEQPTALAASYQLLSTEIMSVKEKLAGPGVLVAAAEPDAGRTTVAANLAISLARDGARVLLIDADLRSPNLHSHFGLENRAGLSEILQGSATVENVVMRTDVEGLLLVTAGQPPVNPVRLFHSDGMGEFIEMISKGADYIVFDSPSGSTFGDSVVLAQNIQNVVLVHEATKAPTIAEHEFHKSLERLGVNIIGLVLNKARQEDCPAYRHFRKNYESALGKVRSSAAPAALGSGDKPVREKPQQYGSIRGDDEE